MNSLSVSLLRAGVSLRLPGVWVVRSTLNHPLPWTAMILRRPVPTQPVPHPHQVQLCAQRYHLYQRQICELPIGNMQYIHIYITPWRIDYIIIELFQSIGIHPCGGPELCLKGKTLTKSWGYVCLKLIVSDGHLLYNIIIILYVVHQVSWYISPYRGVWVVFSPYLMISGGKKNPKINWLFWPILTHYCLKA